MEYKLGELFNLQMGKTPDRHNFSYWNDGSNSWASIADLSKCEKYISETKEKITNVAVKESGIKTIPKDTVIMSFKLSIGKLAITSKPMYSNEAIMAFLDKHVVNISSGYLYYLLMQIKWLEESNKAVMGRTLNKATISQIKIKIHNQVEQKEIVERLDKIYYIIQWRKQQLKLTDDLIKSRFVEMFGDPVTNPLRWEIPSIEEVVSSDKNALKAGPFGSALKKEFYVKSGYKIYGQEQVINEDPFFGDYYIDKEKYKSLKACAVRAGDVLISLVGTYGKLLIMPQIFEPGIINPRLMKITFDKAKVNPIYFKYYFQSDSLRHKLSEKAHGGTMDILNLGIIRKLHMPLPPLELQNQFMFFVHQIDKLKVIKFLAVSERYLIINNQKGILKYG